MKGSYVLLIQLPETQTITVGSLGNVHFPRGHYAYIGSAMGGFKSRLSHHLHQSRKPHWHIDYLLDKAFITSIVVGESEQRTECTIAWTLNRQFDCFPGFGSSDCRCHSHLFFSPDESQMKQVITAMFNWQTFHRT